MDDIGYIIQALNRLQQSGQPTNLMDVLMKASETKSACAEQKSEYLGYLTDANYR